MNLLKGQRFGRIARYMSSFGNSKFDYSQTVHILNIVYIYIYIYMPNNLMAFILTLLKEYTAGNFTL